MLAEALTAAISVGLGCGTCCGTSASSFLAVYILSEGGGVAYAVQNRLKKAAAFHIVDAEEEV